MRISDWSSDVCSSDLERVVPFYVPIPVPVPAPIDTLSGIWGYRLFWGQAKNTPKSTPNSNRRGWSQRVATGRAHAQQDAKNICNLLEKYSPGSEEHTSELQSLMRISYAVICLKKKKIK